MVLELICLLFGAGLAIAGSLTFWPIQNWWDFYIPIVLYMAGWIVGLGFIFVFLAFCGLFVKKQEYNHISKWARFWFLSGIRFITNHAHIFIDFRGRYKIPTREKFLLVCNHRSNFDNFIISDVIGKMDVAFITKESNAKLPLANRLMPGLCYVPIDRDDKLQSLEGFKRAVSLIENKVTSIGVFPEGTRHQDEHVNEFHEGVFNIAIHSRAPIVVCALKNTDKVHKNWPLKPTKVRLRVIETIPYEEYSGMTAKALSDKIHDMIDENYQKM